MAGALVGGIAHHHSHHSTDVVNEVRAWGNEESARLKSLLTVAEQSQQEIQDLQQAVRILRQVAFNTGLVVGTEGMIDLEG